MVIFFVALLLFCFTISNILTRIFVAISSVLLASLIGWCIWTAWESAEDEDIWPDTLAVLRRTRGVLFECVKELNPFYTHSSRVSQHDNIALTDQLGEVRVV
jgi:hypothetical protein